MTPITSFAPNLVQRADLVPDASGPFETVIRAGIADFTKFVLGHARRRGRPNSDFDNFFEYSFLNNLVMTIDNDPALPQEYKAALKRGLRELRKNRNVLIRLIPSTVRIFVMRPDLFNDDVLELQLYALHKYLAPLGGNNNPMDRAEPFEYVLVKVLQEMFRPGQSMVNSQGEKLEPIIAGATTESPIDLGREVQAQAKRDVALAYIRQSQFTMNNFQDGDQNILIEGGIIINLNPGDATRLQGQVARVNARFDGIRGFTVHKLRADIQVETAPIPISDIISPSGSGSRMGSQGQVSLLKPGNTVRGAMVGTSDIQNGQLPDFGFTTDIAGVGEMVHMSASTARIRGFFGTFTIGLTNYGNAAKRRQYEPRDISPGGIESIDHRGGGNVSVIELFGARFPALRRKRMLEASGAITRFNTRGTDLPTTTDNATFPTFISGIIDPSSIDRTNPASVRNALRQAGIQSTGQGTPGVITGAQVDTFLDQQSEISGLGAEHYGRMTSLINSRGVGRFFREVFDYNGIKLQHIDSPLAQDITSIITRTAEMQNTSPRQIVEDFITMTAGGGRPTVETRARYDAYKKIMTELMSLGGSTPTGLPAYTTRDLSYK